MDFFTGTREAMEARGPWNKDFKILKKNDVQTRILNHPKHEFSPRVE